MIRTKTMIHCTTVNDNGLTGVWTCRYGVGDVRLVWEGASGSMDVSREATQEAHLSVGHEMSRLLGEVTQRHG